MTAQIPRERLEAFGRKLAELRRREERILQSQRGWYDEDGVRHGGLMSFIRYYWKVLEPENKLIEGWMLYAIVEHLEAVTFGEIKRLLMTVVPGGMKSLCTDVFWPAWEWGPMGQSHLRYVTFSYSASLTERDNERFRDLIIHPSYTSMWRSFTAVKIGATKVTNTSKGWKLASSVGGVGTGERGDRIILDDPHNIKEAESEIIRKETVRWFREAMSDRLNSLQTGVIVVIMQRAHEEDVAGVILELDLPYVHLMIPMEYEWARQVAADGEPYTTSIGWTDPRYVVGKPSECEGALAWPERFPAEEVAAIKKVKGPYGYATQYQQSPSPRGGGIFQRLWWQLYESPDGKFPTFDYLIASLDSAFTAKEENDPSGFTVWGVFSQPSFEAGRVDAKAGHIWQVSGPKQRRIMLVHAWRKHLAFSADRSLIETRANESHQLWRRRTQEHWGLIEWVHDTCTRFKIDKLLIEAKASGHSAAQELQNRFGRQNWAVQLCPVSGDKVARALACQPTFSQGLVYAPARDWAELVIDECATFPRGRYDDLTDSTTQAISFLRTSGLAQSDDETMADEADRVRHRPRLKAAYPV